MLFDIGGVLLAFDHMTSCNRLSNLCSLTPAEVYERLFKSGLEREFDLGLDPSVFYSRSLTLLGISPSSLSFSEFQEIWGDIFKRKTRDNKYNKGT